MVDGVVLSRSQGAHAATKNTNTNKTTRQWHHYLRTWSFFVHCPRCMVAAWALNTSPRITWHTLVDHNHTGWCTLLWGCSHSADVGYQDKSIDNGHWIVLCMCDRWPVHSQLWGHSSIYKPQVVWRNGKNLRTWLVLEWCNWIFFNFQNCLLPTQLPCRTCM